MLHLVEGCCADYGWTVEQALAVPLCQVFAMRAAAGWRSGLVPAGMTYQERDTVDALRRA